MNNLQREIQGRVTEVEEKVKSMLILDNRVSALDRKNEDKMEKMNKRIAKL